MKSVPPCEIDGRVRAPPSKSQMQRAAALACMSESRVEIANPDMGDDSRASLEIAKALGAKVEGMRRGKGKEEEEMTSVFITPNAGPIHAVLNCRQSGTCLRIFPSIAALRSEPFTITGHGGLIKRPIGMLADALKQLGANAHARNGFPPLYVQGPLKGGRVKLDASISSQPLSGLLMALPLAENDSCISVLGLESKPYVEMTMEMVGKFGGKITHTPALDSFDISGSQRYKCRKIEIEGDWSGASFLLVAGAIAGRIEVSGLRQDSLQADRAILDALKRAGARVRKRGTGSIVVEKDSLSCFEFDISNYPDLAPPLVALAAQCRGTSKLSGIRRLRFKESDRASALKEEFGKMGVKIEVDENEMRIAGGHERSGGKCSGAVRGVTIDPHDDHRIAMACAVAGLASKEGVRIMNSGCVSKSFPKFFETLQEVMAKSPDLEVIA